MPRKTTKKRTSNGARNISVSEVDPEFYAKLAASAKTNLRSIQAEVRYRLRQTFPELTTAQAQQTQ